MTDFIYNPPSDPFIAIIHVDDDILVLNKQSGLLTVEGKHEDHKDCLEARAQSQYPGATIVHRLDMDTSGVLVMARNLDAHRYLSKQFETRQTRKTYIADVWGQVMGEGGSIDAPLICDWPNRPKQMICYTRGKRALTHWRVLERHPSFTRIEFKPITGRSHQLRVHALRMGHPILGDRFYADGEALLASPRLRLHAASLSFHHPNTGLMQNYTAPLNF